MHTGRLGKRRERQTLFARYGSRTLLTLLSGVLLLTSCGATPAQQAAPATTPATADTAVPSATGVVRATGMREPESVLHDEANDRYLVSNINGNPFAEDDNGFISWLAPDGAVVQERWIDGADPEVTLNAPKGLAIIGATLYVADITQVRRFDLDSGRALDPLAIAGATFLNDLVAASDGTLYVSDPGLRATADGFSEAGTDAIYAVGPEGAVERLAAGSVLGHPNGLAILPDGGLVANTLNASRQLYTVGADGAPSAVRSLPGGQLDGLVALADGSLLVSSWETNSIYRLWPDNQVSTVFEDAASPAADIGYDLTRGRLLVPLYATNTILFIPFAQ